MQVCISAITRAELRFGVQRLPNAVRPAHARAIDAVLVTNNVKHFRRVKELVIENWAK